MARFPKGILQTLDDLLERVADQLHAAAEAEAVEMPLFRRWPQAHEIVKAALAEGKETLGNHFDLLVEALLSQRLSLRLGKLAARVAEPYPQLFGGENIPAWLPIPSQEQDQPEIWTRKHGATPNGLGRLIDHLQAEIDGRIASVGELEGLRRTALDRGCAPDTAIETVMSCHFIEKKDGDPCHQPATVKCGLCDAWVCEAHAVMSDDDVPHCRAHTGFHCD